MNRTMSHTNIQNPMNEENAKERKNDELVWNLVGNALSAFPLSGMPLEDHYRPLNVLYLRRPTSSRTDFVATHVHLRAYADEEMRTELDSCIYESVQERARMLLKSKSLDSAPNETVSEAQISDWSYTYIGQEKWLRVDKLFRDKITSTTALEHDDSARRVFAVVTGSHVASLSRGYSNDSTGKLPTLFGSRLFGRKSACETPNRGVLGIQAQLYAMRQRNDDKWEVSDGVPLLSFDPNAAERDLVLWRRDDEDDRILLLPHLINGATVCVNMERFKRSNVDNKSVHRMEVFAASAKCESVDSELQLSPSSADASFGSRQGTTHYLPSRGRDHLSFVVYMTGLLMLVDRIYQLPGVAWDVHVLMIGLCASASWILFDTILVAHGSGGVANHEPVRFRLGCLFWNLLDFIMDGYEANLSRQRRTDNGMMCAKQNAFAAMKAATERNPVGIAILQQSPEMLYDESFDKWVFHADTEESREALKDLVKAKL